MQGIQYNNELKIISLCPVEAKDSEFLLKIFKESRPDLNFINGISEEQKEGIIFEQFKLEQQQLRKMYPNAEFNIVTLDNDMIGRLYIHYGETADRILEIGLLEQYRNFGIGRIILTTLTKHAEQRGKTVNLQVAWFNQGAMAFYERHGFRIIENKGAFYEMQYSP